MDFATCYPEATPLKGISTAEVTEAMIGLFVRIGIPKIMHSDNGKRFNSAEMKKICKLLGMDHTFSYPYHLISNGLVERMNGTLKTMFRKMTSDSPNDWDKYLEPILFAYREAP